MRIVAPHFMLTTAVFATAVFSTGIGSAQQPTDPRTPATPDVTLVALQSLANDTVHHRQPTNSGDGGHGAQGQGGPGSQGGSVAYVPFAKIRDARFTPDGRLVALLVESVKDTTGEPPARRELLAKQVQWDGVSKRWITTDPNLKFPELTDLAKASPTPGGEVASPRTDRTLLASEIVQATITNDPTAGDPTPLKEGQPATETPAPVFWLVPSHQSLAFAVIEHEGRRVPLPWSLLKLSDDRGKIAFKIGADAARLREAPVDGGTNDQPSAELRQRAYKHFGIAVPAWENPPADSSKPPAKAGDKSGEKSER